MRKIAFDTTNPPENQVIRAFHFIFQHEDIRDILIIVGAYKLFPTDLERAITMEEKKELLKNREIKLNGKIFHLSNHSDVVSPLQPDTVLMFYHVKKLHEMIDSLYDVNYFLFLNSRLSNLPREKGNYTRILDDLEFERYPPRELGEDTYEDHR